MAVIFREYIPNNILKAASTESSCMASKRLF
jgi:hypothetical protein